MKKLSGSRALNVRDNLTPPKEDSVIIQVLVSPGVKGAQRLRSIQYDSVDDRFVRYVLEEILPEVAELQLTHRGLQPPNTGRKEIPSCGPRDGLRACTPSSRIGAFAWRFRGAGGDPDGDTD